MTLDFTHRLAMKVSAEGARVRGFLDGGAEKFTRNKVSRQGGEGVRGVVGIGWWPEDLLAQRALPLKSRVIRSPRLPPLLYILVTSHESKEIDILNQGQPLGLNFTHIFKASLYLD